MSNGAVSVKGVLGISGFSSPVLKSVTIRERDGKKPLVFVDVVDLETFNTTGDLIVLMEDTSLEFLAKLKNHEKKPAQVTLRIGQYNGNTSLAVTDIKLV